MTLKNSLISISAAALLVAGITGCSSNGTTAATATATTTTPTTLTVSDGYVVNYSVVATLNDGNSSTTTTTTVACPNVNTKASITAGSSQTAGTATLDLTQDLTDAQIANLESVTVNYAAQTTNGTILTYGTFFDANADGKFVSTDGDILVTDTAFAMSAPVGYANVTPITTLVNARIAQLTASDTNDTNRTAVDALALTQIAAGLGLSATDIQSVDPLTVATSNPTYTLINSMLGQAITDNDMGSIATSLATATAATDAVTALTNIAAGATTGAAFYASAATQIAADSNILAAVASMNLDGMRNQTAGAATAFTPTYLTPSAADFNVTAITMTNATSTLTGAGAKVNNLDLDAAQMVITKADSNVSNKPFTLAIKIGSEEARVNDDANISSLTITVPFDVNSTTVDGLSGALSGDIKWEGITPAGAFFSGDMNATEFKSRATGTDGGVTVAGAAGTAGTIDFNIDDIITTVEANSTSALIVTDQISDMSIALVDHNASMQMTNAASTASVYWGNTQVAATAGTINLTGKSILRNILLDGRATGGTANVAPANAMTFTGTLSTGAVMTGSGTTAMPYVITDDMQLVIDPDVPGSVTDVSETNNTVSFTASSSYFDLNTTVLSAWIKSAAVNANTAPAAGSEFNVSTAITTAGDINYTITTVATDEFGEANTTAYYFMYDRPAYVPTSTIRAFGYSTNDANTSSLFKDYDTNATLSTITTGTVSILENNASAYTWFNETNLTVGVESAELNISAAYDSTNILGTHTLTLQANGTIEVNGTTSIPSDINFTVIGYQITDIHGAESNTTTADTNTSY